MASRASIDDLEALQRAIETDRVKLPPRQLDRLSGWLSVAIDTRQRQRDKSRTPAHDAQVAAYQAAVAAWEAAGGDSTGEPRPLFRDYLGATPAPTPTGVCAVCGMPELDDDALAVEILTTGGMVE